MKRNELIPGEVYAYRQGNYGPTHKVEVIDLEPVERFVQSQGYGTSRATSDKKDGIRVATYEYLRIAVVTEKAYEEAQARAAQGGYPYAAQRIIAMYDGTTEDGRNIVRVLPRYIISTWADHEKAVAERAEDRVRKEEARLKGIEVTDERIAALPDPLKGYFYAGSDGKAKLVGSPSDLLIDLLELLGEEKILTDRR